MTTDHAPVDTADPRSPSVPTAGKASLIQDTWTMTRRDMVRTRRQPEMLFFGVIMGVFFLLLFYWVFGGAISAGTGVDYVQYLVPGIFIITAVVGAQQTGTGLAVDLSEGVTDRFRSLPMSQWAVIAGRTVGDSLRNAAGIVLVAAFGYLLGFRFASIAGGAAAVLIAVALGYAFSWANAAIAAAVKSPEMVGMLSMFWLFPLMLASTIFTPVQQMPGWLQGFATWQPLSVGAQAARQLSNGVAAGESVAWTIGWIIVISAISIPLSMAGYKKQ